MTMRFYKVIGTGLGCRLSHEHQAWDCKWYSQGEKGFFSPNGIRPGFLTCPSPPPAMLLERESATEKKQS